MRRKAIWGPKISQGYMTVLTTGIFVFCPRNWKQGETSDCLHAGCDLYLAIGFQIFKACFQLSKFWRLYTRKVRFPFLSQKKRDLGAFLVDPEVAELSSCFLFSRPYLVLCLCHSGASLSPTARWPAGVGVGAPWFDIEESWRALRRVTWLKFSEARKRTQWYMKIDLPNCCLWLFMKL